LVEVLVAVLAKTRGSKQKRSQMLEEVLAKVGGSKQISN
jgi:hypothetical protein